MATTIYLKQQFNSAVGVSGTSGVGTYQYASLVRSVLALVTAVTNTTTAGSNIQMTQTAGGTVIAFVSPPVAVGFTLSGDITSNLWAKANLLAANATVQMAYYKLSGGVLGAAFLTSSFGTALGTTITLCNWSGSPSSTVFAVGDRIVAIPMITNANALTMVGGDTVTMDYAGLTGAADGDGFFTLTETVVFQREAEFIQLAAYVAASAITLPGVTAAGNTIVLNQEYAGGDGTTNFGTISDGTNTYKVEASTAALPAAATYAQIVGANLNAGGPYTITITWAGTTPMNPNFWGGEYANVDPAAFDVAGTPITATSASPSSGAITTQYANDILVGLLDPGAAITAWQTGYVNRDPANQLLADRSVTATGSYTAGCTIGAPATWSAGMIALKWGTQPMGHLENESGTGNIALENGNDIQLEWALT